jgi:ornithine cyclodeaminase/alanine dehydrogenase-like protein (mu-crystallin family)
MERPRDVYKDADIISGCTDSTRPVIEAEWLEPGQHVTNVGPPLSQEVLERIDRFLRFGTAPAPIGLPEWGIPDDYVAYAALPDSEVWRLYHSAKRWKRPRGISHPERTVFLEEILSGKKPARQSREEITYSERGNLQGAQFYSVAGRTYELAREQGIGRNIPTEWFLQDIRD